MTWREYIRDRRFTLFIVGMTTLISYSFMILAQVEYYIALFVEMIFLVSMSVIGIRDFWIKKKYYDELLEFFKEVEEKSYITEMINKPPFLEGEILYRLLKIEEKYMNDREQRYNDRFAAYRHYIETWVHEVKTPIATSKILIENNKNIATLSIGEEISKIDDYVEQVLYVSKSDTVEKDYLIKKLCLKDIVMSVIRRKSKEIINEGIKPILHDLEYEVLSDEKWIEFIIGQIISNAIKYKGDQPCIEIYSEKIGYHIHLYIRDNGIGIPLQDRSKVFERGFTGENGRKKKAASTGMGLYLCKKLCEKLEVGITLGEDSEDGTVIELIFLEARA